MKKCLINLTATLTVTTTALPLAGCTFNFYRDKATTTLETKIASQVSVIVKSLFYSKNLSTDTAVNIDNFFDTSNSARGSLDIRNLGSNNFNSWGDFQSHWGYHSQIATRGFNQDDYIVSNGNGTLTKAVQQKEKLNKTLDSLKTIDLFGSFTNSDFYQQVITDNAPNQGIVINFLQNWKNNPPSFLKNILSSDLLQQNVQDPLSNSFNLLLNGQWISQQPAPTDYNTLTSFITNWKDGQQTYSQWIDKGVWDITRAQTDDWTTNDFEMLYPAGVLLNYLFYQIGQSSGGTLTPLYLGKIISDNLSNTGNLLTILKQYLSNIINNPKSLFLALSALIPVIKQFIFDKDDNLTNSLKRLTIGTIYPTNKATGSYNVQAIIGKIQTILSNRDTLINFLKQFLTSPFFFDEQIITSGLTLPLSVALATNIDGILDKITNQVADLVKNNSVTIQSVFALIQQFIGQYTGQNGLVFDFDQLKVFLLDSNNGLIILLGTVMNTLKDIIDRPGAVTSADLQKLYPLLGGVNDSSATAFLPNSLLSQLKMAFSDPNSFLSSALTVLYNKNDTVPNSLVDFIISRNQKWIETNYTDYFDYSNQSTNVWINQWNQTILNNDEIIKLNFTFNFSFNNQKEQFTIQGIIENNLQTFDGINNFRFQSITKDQ